jgi:tRNA(Ile)-lysidine synthase
MLLAREAMPGDAIIAVYVDHGLRPRAQIRKDIAAVRAQARHAGARVVVKRVKVAKRGAGVEAAARTARYRALVQAARDAGASVIVTGHHRDDLSETALLALIRGSGLDGLAAMPRQRRLAGDITLLRPLLGYSKVQLREFVRNAGAPFATDETNADPRLRRNAVRALLGDLERLAPGAGSAIARSAAMLAEDKAVLDALAAAAWQRARVSATDEDLSTSVLRELGPALLRRVIRHAVRRARGTLRDFHFEHCDAIAAAIAAGRGGVFHAGQAAVELSAGRMSVVARGSPKSRTPRRMRSTIVVPAGDAIANDTNGHLTLRRSTRASAPRGATLLDDASLPAGTELQVRAPREGDTCIPSGRTRAVSLARFLAKSGVPKHRRTQIPLLCHEERIVAAVGVRVMEPFAPRSDRVLAIVWDGSH